MIHKVVEVEYLGNSGIHPMHYIFMVYYIHRVFATQLGFNEALILG